MPRAERAPGPRRREAFACKEVLSDVARGARGFQYPGSPVAGLGAGAGVGGGGGAAAGTGGGAAVAGGGADEALPEGPGLPLCPGGTHAGAAPAATVAPCAAI